MKIGIFVTHPVQYHTPIWKALAEQKDIDLEVFYFSDQGISGHADPGFGEAVVWDQPLLEGYGHTFLSREKIENAKSFRIPDADKLFREKAFDAVMLHGYAHAFARQIIRLSKRYKFKVLLRGEFTDSPRLSANLLKRFVRNSYLAWFYRHVSHFCPVSTKGIEHLKRRGIPDQKLTFSPYSVNDGLIQNQKDKCDYNQLRERLNIREDQTLFLFSGKLIARKQPLLLAQAALAFAQDERFCLCILGSGDQEKEVYKMLDPALGNRLMMPGFVNQSKLGEYFGAADVFVLPSAFDTWGLVVNEAMHWGLPCILSDRTDSHHDLIIEGETGFTVPWNSVDKLISTMKKFLDEPELKTRMGEKASKHIMKYRIAETISSIQVALKKTLGLA